ncbi:MAG: NAD(P)/FAD-dependent oxidoreductase [Candidatus Thorarchaeota archaeon]
MNFDTIIIGGGIIGSSTAYHLKRNNPEQKILLLEKNNKIAEGNTAKSAALYRNLFSSSTSQKLSTSSILFYESIAEKIGLKNQGYFWMLSEDEWKKSELGFRKLDKDSDKFEILEPEEIPGNLKINTTRAARFNEIYKVLYGHRCGSLSAINLARYYAMLFEELGGRIQLGTEITKISLTEEEHYYPPWMDVKIKSLKDHNGNDYSATNYIFAIGAWSNSLLSPIGIASQIYPKKRQMFLLKLHDAKQLVKDPTQTIPILILPTGGVYIKPVLQNKIIVVGCANELGNPYQITEYPAEAEEGYYYNVIDPILHHYFPDLTEYQLFSKWAGYYAYYWPDKNPVIEKVANILWVSGTSGSGIMKADAIGRIAAGKLVGKEKVSLYDNTIFTVNELSLKKRKVDTEELII